MEKSSKSLSYLCATGEEEEHSIKIIDFGADSLFRLQPVKKCSTLGIQAIARSSNNSDKSSEDSISVYCQ